VRRVCEKLSEGSVERSPFGWAILSWIATAALERNAIAKVCQHKQKARAQARKADCQGYPTPEDGFWHRAPEELGSYEGV
jgi:hypothetical protein